MLVDYIYVNSQSQRLAAKVIIMQGKPYDNYREFVVNTVQEMVKSYGSKSNHLVVPLLSSESYDELIVEVFETIQSNVEDDSHIKLIDPMYLDTSEILDIVKDYPGYAD